MREEYKEGEGEARRDMQGWEGSWGEGVVVEGV